MLPQCSPLYAVSYKNETVYTVVGWDAETRLPYLVPHGKRSRSGRAVLADVSAQLAYFESFKAAYQDMYSRVPVGPFSLPL